MIVVIIVFVSPYVLIEKATSHLLLEPDWQSIIEICDIICQGECQ